MHDYMTMPEVADCLGITEKAAWSRLQAAKRRLGGEWVELLYAVRDLRDLEKNEKKTIIGGGGDIY